MTQPEFCIFEKNDSVHEGRIVSDQGVFVTVEYKQGQHIRVGKHSIKDRFTAQELESRYKGACPF